MLSDVTETTLSSKECKNNQTEVLEALNSYGDLILKEKSLNKIPNDLMFPDELNCYLRDQIQYYAHENAMVKRNLSDLEGEYEQSKTKITELEQKLNTYENALNKAPYVNSNQVAVTKIVELTKKLREKTAEVESLKTRYSKLEKTLLQLKNEQIETKLVQPEPLTPPSNESESEIKKLQDKLNHVNNKLAESRNLNFQLKNDLKMANKWLHQEIGESFESLQSLTNSNSNWRGRSQIIFDLQQKNSELKEKLRCSQEKFSMSSQESTVSTRDKSKESLLIKENDDLKSKYEDLKKKYDSTKARCLSLDIDYGLFKSKFNMLKEQSEKDQKIIETLSLQLSHTNTKAEKAQKEKNLRKLQTEKYQLTKEIDELKNVVNALKEQIEERNRKIEYLKKTQVSSVISNVSSKGNQYPEIPKLLEYIEKQKEQISSERDAHHQTQILLKIEKQKAAKAESLAAKLELDTNRSSYYCSSVSLKGMDRNLNDQLELAQETVRALQTRLEIEQYERNADLQEFSKLLREIDDRAKKT